jgi:hypothetical protein
LEIIMAASSQSGRSGKGLRWLLGGIGLLVVLAAIYTGGWYYAASALKTNVLRALGQRDKAGISGECTDMDFRGFPFGIGMYCSKVMVDDHVNGLSASFDSLTSSAPVYQPGHIAWQLKSPAEFRTARGLTVSAEWTDLQSSLVTKGRGIQQGTTTIEGLKAGIVLAFNGQTINATADRTEVHVRQNGADLEAAIAVENSNILIKDFPQPLPALTTNADITLTGKAGLLDGSDSNTHGLRGTSGLLHRVVADIGDGRVLTLSGPFSFDDDGYVSGQFKLEIDQLGPWRDSLKTVIPGAKHTIDMAGKLLKALAAGGDKVSVDLTADHGQITLSGFIPLGSIPPI